MSTERLTLTQAQERVAANVDSDSLIDPAAIDWTQPGRDAVTIAGLAQSTNALEERNKIAAVALALIGYQAHLDFEAGRLAERASLANDDARQRAMG